MRFTVVGFRLNIGVREKLLFSLLLLSSLLGFAADYPKLILRLRNITVGAPATTRKTPCILCSVYTFIEHRYSVFCKNPF